MPHPRTHEEIVEFVRSFGIAYESGDLSEMDLDRGICTLRVLAYELAEMIRFEEGA